MRKLALGLVAAAAVFTAAPAMAQVGLFAGPGGVGVEFGAPGYYQPYGYGYYNAPYGYGYYDYYGGPAWRGHAWHGHGRVHVHVGHRHR